MFESKDNQIEIPICSSFTSSSPGSNSSTTSSSSSPSPTLKRKKFAKERSDTREVTLLLPTLTPWTGMFENGLGYCCSSVKILMLLNYKLVTTRLWPTHYVIQIMNVLSWSISLGPFLSWSIWMGLKWFAPIENCINEKSSYLNGGNHCPLAESGPY